MAKTLRGTVILDTKKGILLTAMSSGLFLLPGGGVENGESGFQAAIRELQEETGLSAHFAQILFRHESRSNMHTVVYAECEGNPKAMMEIEQIAYFKPDSNLNISNGTRDIITKYYKIKDSIKNSKN